MTMKKKLATGLFENNMMRKIYLALLILSMLVLGSAANADAAILFQDDFEDGNNTIGWSFIGSHTGNWIVSDGILHHGGGYDEHQAIALIDGILTPAIFTLEADISVKSNIHNNPDWGHVGLAWGVNPATMGFNTSYLRTHEDRVTNWSTPYATELYLNAPGTTNGPTYHLRVDVNSVARSMNVTLDDFQTTFTGTDFDTINKNTAGGIGHMSWSDEVTWDNVRLSSPVPLPGGIWLLGSGCAALFGLIRRRRKI
jgi:hypothetical protein